MVLLVMEINFWKNWKDETFKNKLINLIFLIDCNQANYCIYICPLNK